MDPVTAISLASSVLAFITFSTKLVQEAIKIHELGGSLKDNLSRESIVPARRRPAGR